MPIAHQYVLRNVDRLMRNCVGAGSLAPKSANIAANTGMTKISSTFTSAIARPMTAIGYVIADFTFFVSLTVASKYPATLLRISARPPLASPASTIETNRVLNEKGNFLTEAENELPWEMSARTSRMTMRKQGSSV